MKNKKEKRIANSIIYNTIGSGSYLFAQWLIMYIVLWMSGYKQEGIFSTIVSVSAIFFAFSLFGMRNYQSTDLKGEYSEKTYIYSRFITSIFAIICCMLYCIYLQYDLYIILCIFAYMIFKFSEGLIDILHGSLQKQWLFKNIGISYIIRAIVSLIAFPISLYISNNLLISISIMGLCCLLVVYLYDYKVYKKNIGNMGTTSYAKLKKLLIICLPLAIYTLLSNYALSYPKLAVGKVLGATVLGYYTTYINIAMMIQVAAGFITSPLVTYFAELYKDRDKVKMTKSIKKCIAIILIIGAIGIAGCSIFGKTIFGFMFGKEILDYYYLLNQAIIISLLTAIMWLLSGIITILRRFKILIIVNLIYCLLIGCFSHRILYSGLIYINYYIIALILAVIVAYYVYIKISLRKENYEKN